MARGNAQAQQGAQAGLKFANQGGAALMPELMQEAGNPQGFAPGDLARMNTTAQQSAGGSQAATTGEGGLLAARTKNPGAAEHAIAESGRTAGEQLSKNALGVNVANAKLKEEQQQEGLKGLEGVTLGGLGAVAPNANANTEAVNSSWDWAKDILAPALGAAGGPANAFLGRS